MQGKKEYQEKLFNSFQLSERVPKENFYRRLKSELDLSFITPLTKIYYGEEGQKSIDPIVFFKLILVGYLENLNSDRKIINHASMRMDVLFFIGYDIDEELPWHSTLSRTRALYGEEVFKELFKKVLSLCVNKGMVSGKRQAIDSAYIKANASMDSLLEKEVLADGDVYTEELNENDEEKKTVSSQKKKEVDQHHNWKSEAYKGQPSGGLNSTELDANGHLIRPKFLSNHTHYSKTDPDARISVKPGKPRQLNYSAQTSVDTKGHVITNILADFSDKRDSQSLPKAVEQTKANLKENNLELKEILGDTGYSSGTALKYLKENNITGYIPNFGLYKNTREGFIYNKELDQYECQRGNRAVLPFKKTSPNTKGYLKKIYRSSETTCKNCPLRVQCIGSKTKFKKIDDSVDKPYYDEMHERLKTINAKRLKKQRSSTVEPVLGTLINFTGMRRIWTRGIKNANKFMIGAATAYNLKKWLNYKVKKVNIQVQQLPIPELSAKQSVSNSFLCFITDSIFVTKKYNHKVILS